jgi:hypothetical protein
MKATIEIDFQDLLDVETAEDVCEGEGIGSHLVSLIERMKEALGLANDEKYKEALAEYWINQP